MNLNSAQQQFVAAGDKYIRLLAPAGSGKTASLLCRCVELLRHDASRRVLIVTFTKVARAVLQERIKRGSEFEPLRGNIEVCTLNSFGFRFLKNESRRVAIITKRERKSAFYNWMKPTWDQKKYERIQNLMTSSNYLSRAEKLFDMIDAFKECGFRDNGVAGEFEAHFNFLLNERVRFFQTKLEELCSLGFVTKVAFDHWDKPGICENLLTRWFPFYCEFSKNLFAADKISLNDQKFHAEALLRRRIAEGAASRKGHRTVFSDVFVDEFQDVSPLDLAFVQSIVTFHKANLVIVGDDDQTIFEFRGSTPNFIIEPSRFFDGAFATFTLGVNYRSPRNIVAMSQRLILNNKNRVAKAVSTSSVQDAEIELAEKYNSSELFEYVMDCVKGDLAGGEHKRIALIARKRSQLLPYEVLFTKENVDYFTPDDLNVFLDRAFSELSGLLEIKKKLLRHPEWISGDDIIALCNKVGRYELNKNNKAQLQDYLARKLTEKTPKKIYDVLKLSTVSLQFMAKEVGEKGRKEPFAHLCARAVLDFLNARTVAGTIHVFSELFGGFAKDYGKSDDAIFYTDPPFYHLIDFAERYKDDFDVFLHDIESAIAKSRAVALRNDDAGVDNDTAGADGTVNKRLHLTTALRIKGEEYDAVYILDANDAIWPNRNARTADELEGERRLFYVAATRARKKLNFSFSTHVHDEFASASRYLQEMGICYADSQ
jgi:DNA helicase-2/ATP-dependent DNA helicase PcrA